MVFHHRDVHAVASREQSGILSNLRGTKHISPLDREHLVNNVQQRLKCRPDGLPPIDGCVAVQHLLQDFRVGYKSLPAGNQSSEDELRLTLVRVWGPDKVHRDVRVDEDQLR